MTDVFDLICSACIVSKPEGKWVVYQCETKRGIWKGKGKYACAFAAGDEEE